MTLVRQALTAVLLVLAGCGAAAAGDYWFNPITFNSFKMENRPEVVFPGPRTHISPYPMTKRSASIWNSDQCWRTCTGEVSWRFHDCRNTQNIEVCRMIMDTDNRTCQRTCRTMGGPLLPLD